MVPGLRLGNQRCTIGSVSASDHFIVAKETNGVPMVQLQDSCTTLNHCFIDFKSAVPLRGNLCHISFVHKTNILNILIILYQLLCSSIFCIVGRHIEHIRYTIQTISILQSSLKNHRKYILYDYIQDGRYKSDQVIR